MFKEPARQHLTAYSNAHYRLLKCALPPTQMRTTAYSNAHYRLLKCALPPTQMRKQHCETYDLLRFTGGIRFYKNIKNY